MGLVEKAWKRLDPPTQEKLAELLEIKRTNLSKLNKGTMKMTPEYAQRIADVVPGISVADLGAPTSVVAEADPTVLQTLQELATKVASTTRRHTALRAEVRQLRARVQQLEDRPWPGEAPSAGQV